MIHAAVNNHWMVQYSHIRQGSEALVEQLSEADAQLQSMTDASPSKWHLAHTSWFFETLILCAFLPGYQRYNPHFQYLFNSYYNGVGQQYPRDKRGLISRPSLSEILDYRAHIDEHMIKLLREESLVDPACLQLFILGLHHEQQHQELLLMDIKHAFFQNPMLPVYRTGISASPSEKPTQNETRPTLRIAEGVYEIGSSGQEFAFDNERPRHRVYLSDCQVSPLLVSNREYLQFIEDNGYRNPLLWLSDGWAWKNEQNTEQPYYWVKRDDEWHEFTLYGLRPLQLDGPVSHVTYYEADAFAQWANQRLPTEAEWEVAAQVNPDADSDTFSLHPSASKINAFMQNVWQWTSSSYGPYPGFRPFAGAAGEYNGKFMNGQKVLRGSACITPVGHGRHSYRNFFYPHQSWAFTGIRLAKDLL